MKDETRKKHVRRRARLEELRNDEDGMPLRKDGGVDYLHGTTEYQTFQTIDKIHITDHSIVRYVERVYGIDINAIRQHMIAEGRDELIRKLQSGRFPLGNGTKLVVQNGTIITVVGKLRSTK